MLEKETSLLNNQNSLSQEVMNRVYPKQKPKDSIFQNPYTVASGESYFLNQNQSYNCDDDNSYEEGGNNQDGDKDIQIEVLEQITEQNQFSSQMQQSKIEKTLIYHQFDSQDHNYYGGYPLLPITDLKSIKLSNDFKCSKLKINCIKSSQQSSLLVFNNIDSKIPNEGWRWLHKNRFIKLETKLRYQRLLRDQTKCVCNSARQLNIPSQKLQCLSSCKNQVYSQKIVTELNCFQHQVKELQSVMIIRINAQGENSVWGLVSLKQFHKNSVLFQVSGVYITQHQCQQIILNKYMKSQILIFPTTTTTNCNFKQLTNPNFIADRQKVVAIYLDSESNISRFILRSKAETRQKKVEERFNCKLVRVKMFNEDNGFERIVLMATKDISIGDFILIQ